MFVNLVMNLVAMARHKKNQLHKEDSPKLLLFSVSSSLSILLSPGRPE